MQLMGGWLASRIYVGDGGSGDCGGGRAVPTASERLHAAPNQQGKASAYENVAEGNFVGSVANAASSLWDDFPVVRPDPILF